MVVSTRLRPLASLPMCLSAFTPMRTMLVWSMTSSTPRIERVEVVVACARHGKTHEFRTVLDFEEMVRKAEKAIDDEIGGELREHLGHIMRKWPNTIQTLADVALSEALGVTKEGTRE